MSKSDLFELPDSGVKIRVTKAAQNLVGRRRMPELISKTTLLAQELGARFVYIAKRSREIQISAWITGATIQGSVEVGGRADR